MTRLCLSCEFFGRPDIQALQKVPVIFVLRQQKTKLLWILFLSNLPNIIGSLPLRNTQDKQRCLFDDSTNAFWYRMWCPARRRSRLVFRLHPLIRFFDLYLLLIRFLDLYHLLLFPNSWLWRCASGLRLSPRRCPDSYV